MRFLCLHGRGTNAEFFKGQTAKIRDALGTDNDFVFINGNVPAKPMSGMTLDTEFGEERLGFWPLHGGDDEQFRCIYQNLRGFIQTHGPFFGFIGFSEGASVAATILIEDVRRHGGSLGIECAIFFCGVQPLDLDLERIGKIRPLEPAVDGVLLSIPTAHVWSEAGVFHPGTGKSLMALCDEEMREVVLHNLGHDIPGARSDESWRETMRAIERTIERAKVYKSIG